MANKILKKYFTVMSALDVRNGSIYEQAVTAITSCRLHDYTLARPTVATA